VLKKWAECVGYRLSAEQTLDQIYRRAGYLLDGMDGLSQGMKSRDNLPSVYQITSRPTPRLHADAGLYGPSSSKPQRVHCPVPPLMCLARVNRHLLLRLSRHRHESLPVDPEFAQSDALCS
jgi:hypothetical protein